MPTCGCWRGQIFGGPLVMRSLQAVIQSGCFHFELETAMLENWTKKLIFKKVFERSSEYSNFIFEWSNWMQKLCRYITWPYWISTPLNYTIYLIGKVQLKEIQTVSIPFGDLGNKPLSLLFFRPSRHFDRIQHSTIRIIHSFQHSVSNIRDKCCRSVNNHRNILCCKLL